MSFSQCYKIFLESLGLFDPVIHIRSVFFERIKLGKRLCTPPRRNIPHQEKRRESNHNGPENTKKNSLPKAAGIKEKASEHQRKQKDKRSQIFPNSLRLIGQIRACFKLSCPSCFLSFLSCSLFLLTHYFSFQITNDLLIYAFKKPTEKVR